MKKRFASLVAASLVIGTVIPTTFAATTGTPKQSKATITVDNKVLSNPYQFAASDGSSITTYMPMYYIDQALAKAGYKAAWDGHTWALTIANGNPDFSGIQIGSGNTSITVNGTLIKKINTMAQKDPAAGRNAQMTTYIPIYYVQPLLDALGIKNTWDGNKHVWGDISPITLNAGATYGPATGSTSIDKHLVIAGTGVTVQNTKVNGNIYVNPGTDGDVTLNNVTATEAIVVLSGAAHSIHLNNVVAPTLTISSSSAVHVVSEGTTQIGTTKIPSSEKQSVTLDQQSGSLGNVTVGASSTVTFSGSQTFGNVSVTGSAKLNVTSDTTIGSMAVSGSNAQIAVASGATITGVTIANVSGVNIANDGKISTLTNNAPSTGVTLGGSGQVTTTQGNVPTGGVSSAKLVSDSSQLATALSDTSVTSIQLSGDITLDSALTLSRPVTIDGAGHHLNLPSQLTIDTTATGATIKNVTLDHGIYEHADDVTLDNVAVTASEFDPGNYFGILIGEGSKGTGATGVVVKNSTINGNGNDSMGITNLTGQAASFTVDNTTISNGWCGIYSDVATVTATNNKVSDEKHAIYLDGTTGFTTDGIAHNTISSPKSLSSGGHGDGITVPTSTTAKTLAALTAGNTFSGVDQSLEVVAVPVVVTDEASLQSALADPSDMTIQLANDITLSSPLTIIRPVTIDGASYHLNMPSQLTIASTANGTILKNVTLDHGIYEHADNVTLDRVTATASEFDPGDYFGILIGEGSKGTGATGVVIQNSTINGGLNDSMGITNLTGQAASFTVDNTTISNGWCGIYSDAASVTATNNKISDEKHAIYLDASSSFTADSIAHNVISSPMNLSSGAHGDGITVPNGTPTTTTSALTTGNTFNNVDQPLEVVAAQ